LFYCLLLKLFVTDLIDNLFDDGEGVAALNTVGGIDYPSMEFL